jgi:hypothetical protein
MPLLRSLDLSGNEVPVARRGAVGRALLAHNAAPKLRILDVSRCGLGDEGLSPLLDGLATNTRLQSLRCSSNAASTAFENHRMAADARVKAFALEQNDDDE